MSIKIKKVKLTKGRTLEVTLTEFVEVNGVTAQNEVVKKCDYLAHNDFLEALKALAPHMVSICELVCDSEEITVTGFTVSDSGESTGVVLIGSKKLSTEKVLNLVAPFTDFNSEDYPRAYELSEAIDVCIGETEQYLTGKCAIKQTSINFDEDDAETEINIADGTAPKKRGRKKKSEEVFEPLEEAV